MISLAEHNPELINEWDYEKNGELGLNPYTVSYGSARKVWWKCNKGHSYLMGLNSRTTPGKAKQQCSVCAGIQIIEGYNDLYSKYPDLVKEWNYEKNEELGIRPKEVSYGSSKKVWWVCEKGHEWNAPISRRTGSQRSSCPFCSNQMLLKNYNDLESKYPDIAKEFNIYKNKKLPSEYLHGSSSKVWWICSKCGYEWKTAIVNRTGEKGTGCPNCAPKLNRANQLKNQIKTKGSLFDNYPDLMNEWIFEKNDRSPKDIVPGSEYKAWWKCSKCNYEWKAIVASRTTNGSGCPVCGGRIVVEGLNDIKTLYPELMKEWDYDKNNSINLFPEQVSKYSDKKAWWICPICDNSYQTAVKHRSLGTGCPNCANEIRTSFPEQAIYYYLKQEFEDTQNRMDLVGKEVDIFIPCMNLGIEYDGVYFHNSKEALEREKNKYNYLKEYGIKLIRIREKGLDLPSHADYTLHLTKKNNDKEIENIIYSIFDIIKQLFNYDSNLKIDLSNDRQKIYNQYILQRKENSVEKLYPELMKEWDYDKNIVKPSSIVPGSEKKIWWKCNKGHSYEQQVSNHIKGAGCPYCSGLKVIQGENDLETLFPNLAREWNYKKNKIKPSEIKYGSSKKVWWLCPEGHSYEAAVSHRTGNKKEKCPICANKKVLIGYNDLKSLKPDLVKEWDYNKNNLGPDKYTCGSQQKVWWICPQGHSYETLVRSRAILNTGCPICNGKQVLEGYNDFESQQPELIKEWNYEKNNELGIYPNKIHYHAWKNVWWKCSKCNYEWKAMPGKRSEGSGCPKCSNKQSGRNRIKLKIEKEGSLKDKYPDIVKQWDYNKNNNRPEEYTYGSQKKVWWICKNGHSYERVIKSQITQNGKCPICK